MQKKLIALAIAGLVSAPAFAQSNVTIYGLVDMGFAYRTDNIVSTVGSKSAIDSGMAAGNRIGFKGTEDLGNGLKAGFVVEQGFFADSGTGRSDGLASRQSYLSLSGGFGTVAVGRMYSPQDSMYFRFDPFGNGTVGQMSNIATKEVRLNNAVAYISPSFSGLSVTLGYSTDVGENQSGGSFGNDVAGGASVGNEAAGNVGDVRAWVINPMYTNGPLTVALNYHEVEAAKISDNKTKVFDIGGSYDFGVVKLAGMYGTREDDDTVAGVATDIQQWFVGITVPVGAAGKVLAGYGQAENDATGANGADAEMWSIGYNHALSKRTGLYAVYADVSNSGGVANTGLNKSLGDASYSGQGYQEGFQVGVRHSF